MADEAPKPEPSTTEVEVAIQSVPPTAEEAKTILDISKIPFKTKAIEESPTPEPPVVEESSVVEEPEYAKILRENGGIESNIPVNSPYWRIRP